MSAHGIMKPNPVLLEGLDERLKFKSRPVIAHDLGAGLPCLKCGPECSGFQLHFWRKHCCNCRCGKADHNVVDETSGDRGHFFVGNLFDRPIRTRLEELEFSYGDMEGDEEGGSTSPAYLIPLDARGGGGRVKFDWVPPDASARLAQKYLEQLPHSEVPVAGSRGASRRQHKLEKQFPLHDIEPERCHDLPDEELQSMREYVGHVKRDVAGMGTLHEVGRCFPDSYGNDDRVHRHESFEADLADLPPPPPELLFPKEDGASEGWPSLDDARSEQDVPAPMPTPSGAIKRCQNCERPLYEGDVAIVAQRAGPDKAWHPGCFKCHTCKELLVDLLYYHKSGKVYCARDYALIAKIPRCAACDELIFAVEYTGADGKFWHLRHFCCWECDSPLADKKYVPDGKGQPHCLGCHQRKFGKVCRACSQHIAPEDVRLSLPLKLLLQDAERDGAKDEGEQGMAHWHASPKCFRCKVCGKSLVGEKMSFKHGFLVCSSTCYSRAASLFG